MGVGRPAVGVTLACALVDRMAGLQERVVQPRVALIRGDKAEYLFNPRYKRMPASCCASGGVMQVDMLRHEVVRSDVSDPALNGLMDEVVGHPSLHLAGLHR